MITRINESKTLTKYASCKYTCKFDSKKCNLNKKWNNEKCRCECKHPKEHCVCEKIDIWNPTTCGCKNGKYVGSITDNSVIKCDQIIKETKTVPIKSTSIKTVLTKCTSTNFYILLAFLLITIALLILGSICCYLIKYQAKQKPSLPCHYTISKLKEIGY